MSACLARSSSLGLIRSTSRRCILVAASAHRYTIIHDYFRGFQTAQRSFRLSVKHTSIRTRLVSRSFSSALTRLAEGERTSPSQQRPIPGQQTEKPREGEEVKPPEPPPAPPPPDRSYLEQYSSFFRRLTLSLPDLLHRPTRDDLLKVTNNFWHRVHIRFKWFTIRGFRKFNADDISAFLSWFLMGQALWIFIGTTGFFSVVIMIVNSLSMQESVARAISNYLTHETGITIHFESAVVPKWKDSKISFKNVYISRRPKSMMLPAAKPPRDPIHKTAARWDIGHHPAYIDEEEDEAIKINQASAEEGEDTNFTQFDLDVDSIDVTLSLWRWLDGRGIVTDAVIKGVRGVVDRRFVQWDPEKPLDPALFRHESHMGDFELESLELEDVLVTVYQPDHFRPYTASIFKANLGLFRKEWLFYDFLSADSIVGQFDNCLFSLHKPQSIGRTMEEDLKDGMWKRMSRLRIDGVNVDHLQALSGVQGPISWITSGKLDAVFDIRFPRDPTGVDLPAMLSEIAAAAASSLADRIPGQRELAKPALRSPTEEDLSSPGPRPQVIVDIDLRFRDLKAAVPIFNSELSYVNFALIRPIVAFINANRTLIPIHCRAVKDLDEFHGAWTMWETGLMDAISQQTYDALAHHVTNVNINRRLKTVSLWSLHLTANAVVASLRNIADPVSTALRDIYLTEHMYEQTPT